MKKPYFSIITCTYNSEKFIQTNIDSVKDQSFKDYEHVFIDGSSTDKTPSLIRKYQKSSKQKIIFKNYPPKGIANAFNLGIKHSSGKYLIHMNSDDSFFDNRVLEDVYQFLKIQNEPDWVYGQANIIEENGKKVGIFPNRWVLQQAWNYLLKFFNFIPHQAVFVQRNVFNKFGLFDQDLKFAMDEEMWLRIAKKTKWYYFDRVIANYMLRKDANSSSKENLVRNRHIYEQVQKQHMNFFEYTVARGLNYLVSKYNKTTR